MPYVYEDQRAYTLTDGGQRALFKMLRFAKAQLQTAGAVRADKLMAAVPEVGHSWEMLACIDRLVEVGELKEVTRTGCGVAQYRIFTEPHN